MTSSEHVALLVGGVGGAKLAYGLAQILPPGALSIIVNTGDDFELHGLHISPDVDTVTYTLAGLANLDTGWGLANDTFVAKKALARLGQPDWFTLGDKDIATHLTRTAMLNSGHSLTGVTAHICQQLGIAHAVLPVSNQPVRTIVETADGDLPFQEYFVRLGWQPVLTGLRFEGAAQARPSEAVLDALHKATLIVVGPSNPLLSIDPILAVPGVRDAIINSAAPRIAISPIIGGRAVKGPAAKIMGELGMDVSPLGVAKYYTNLLTGFILDAEDSDLVSEIEQLNLYTGIRNTIMTSPEDKVSLAQQVLDFAKGVRV